MEEEVGYSLNFSLPQLFLSLMSKIILIFHHHDVHYITQEEFKELNNISIINLIHFHLFIYVNSFSAFLLVKTKIENQIDFQSWLILVK